MSKREAAGGMDLPRPAKRPRRRPLQPLPIAPTSESPMGGSMNIITDEKGVVGLEREQERDEMRERIRRLELELKASKTRCTYTLYIQPNCRFDREGM
eukprot:1393711-Amorphochlora_amoeboformis.AAC.1